MENPPFEWVDVFPIDPMGIFQQSLCLLNPEGFSKGSSGSWDFLFLGGNELETGTSEPWKNPGWLGYIGDYTTQAYRDYNKPL